jgi:hypothetical protein
VTGTLPLDFETGTFALLILMEVPLLVANPVNKTGINTTIAKMVKGTGAQWTGSKLKMASQLIFRLKKNIK